VVLAELTAVGTQVVLLVLLAVPQVFSSSPICQVSSICLVLVRQVLRVRLLLRSVLVADYGQGTLFRVSQLNLLLST
jgi:hypothetical protein